MGAVGPTQLLLIALVILLLFGGRKIPELMRGLGQGMKEFKDASSGKKTRQTARTRTPDERPCDVLVVGLGIEVPLLLWPSGRRHLGCASVT